MSAVPFAFETVILMFASFVFFTLGCWYLANLVTRPEWVRINARYSRTALRLSHAYKVTAVAFCVSLWFWAVVSNFWAILSQPPF